MADKTVPVTYRKGKLRAGGLGSLAKAKDGSSGQFYIYGNNGPELTDLQSILDSVLGSTRGGIIYRGASGWAKLDPGTSGNFLKSNGTGADPSYAAVSQARVFLSSVTANNSSANLDFTSGIDGTYSNYEFIIENLVPATNNDPIYLQVSTNAGSSYETTNYIGGSTSVIVMVAAAVLSNSSGGGLCGRYILANPSGASNKKFLYGSGAAFTSSSTVLTQFAAGLWNSNTAVNALRFTTQNGNLSAGTIRMYGLKGF